jgi:hypothetical protein
MPSCIEGPRTDCRVVSDAPSHNVLLRWTVRVWVLCCIELDRFVPVWGAATLMVRRTAALHRDYDSPPRTRRGNTAFQGDAPLWGSLLTGGPDPRCPQTAPIAHSANKSSKIWLTAVIRGLCMLRPSKADSQRGYDDIPISQKSQNWLRVLAPLVYRRILLLGRVTAIRNTGRPVQPFALLLLSEPLTTSNCLGQHNGTEVLMTNSRIRRKVRNGASA